MGIVTQEYAVSSNLTVTNLHSLPSSQTWVAGWESALVDNTTNKYDDYLVSGKFTVTSANNQAGEIRIYVVAMLDDSTWPDVFDGTESVETITDTEMRDAICKLGAATVVDTGAGDVYYTAPFSVKSLFGVCPAKFGIFVTQNASTTTTAGLAASGNQVTVKGSYYSVA